MASLYDLELQESNNFIHYLMADGQPLSLKLMNDQLQQFKNMGEAGKEILAQMNDPESEMGKSLVKLKQLEKDLKAAMDELRLTAEQAVKANDILIKNPESLGTLDESDKKAVSDYWIKKKSIITKLTAKGYTAAELFA